MNDNDNDENIKYQFLFYYNKIILDKKQMLISPELKKEMKDYSKSDLWDIGILLYYISMKGNFPFNNYSKIEEDINNGILYDSLKGNILSDLIEKLLKYKKDERIEWKDYFNYKFSNINIPKKLDILGKNRNPISKNEIDILYKKVLSLCRIEYEKEGEICYGSGFFVEIENNDIPVKYALFTNNYILNNIEINKTIKFEYYDTKIFSSNYESRIKNIKIENNRFVLENKELDFTCIQLFESDGIKNYFKIDYNTNLENEDIFILNYQINNNITFSLGKILSFNNNKIRHCASVIGDFSGSPIILRNNDYKIIGINSKQNDRNNNIIKINNNNFESNIAISFNSIINYIFDSIFDTIIGTFKITKKDINRKIQIINSFEQFERNNSWSVKENDYKYKNEWEIEENI